jgi:hypothetical protein
MVVQLTPFLGTLRRKNLISNNFGAFMYGLFLVTSYIISVKYSPGGTLTQIRLTGCFAFAAAFWRMSTLPSWASWLQNKYLIWTVIGMVMHRTRPMFDVWAIADVTTAFRVGALVMATLGYYKINYGYNNSKGNRAKKSD